MGGRVRRKAGLAFVPAPSNAAQHCALCERPLGRRIEWHHLVPRSQGGRETVALHPICHRAIHAGASNAELARRYARVEALRARPDLVRFLSWVADKPADFHAPTRRASSPGN